LVQYRTGPQRGRFGQNSRHGRAEGALFNLVLQYPDAGRYGGGLPFQVRDVGRQAAQLRVAIAFARALLLLQPLDRDLLAPGTGACLLGIGAAALTVAFRDQAGGV
jgi:hypothetical protein